MKNCCAIVPVLANNLEHISCSRLLDECVICHLLVLYLWPETSSIYSRVYTQISSYLLVCKSGVGIDHSPLQITIIMR